MKKNIKNGIFICSMCLVAIIGFGINNNQNNEPDTIYMHGDFAVNTDNPKELIGFSDYYFVAEIKEIEDTHYRHEVTIETEDGFKTVGQPYTNYEVLVTDNIKGELPTAQPISVTKAGGVSENGRSIILYEDDSLLEVGKKYIITATAQPDGTLLVSGPNSSEEIHSKRSLDNYSLNYDNEITYNRERFEYIAQ